MKIAIYHDLPPGGAHRSIEAILERLVTRADTEMFHLDYHQEKNRFVSDWKALVNQRFAAKDLGRTIDGGGFDVVLVTHDQFLQCPWVLRYLETPSVFLCQEPTRSYYEYFLKVPSNLPLANRLYEKANRCLRKNIEETNARQADVLIANSNYSAEVLFRSYGRNAEVVHLGIDPAEYFPEKVAKKNQIMIVGNDEPQKDLGLAIHTISKIKKNRPQLIVVSPRKYDQERIAQIAARVGVKLEIYFGVSPDQMRRLYSESKITLATAYLEPFGLSVIESMACGTPVVAVNEAGFRETIEKNVTGFLVERDAYSLAKACEDVLIHPQLAKKMGEAGIKHTRENFTWDRTVSQLITIFADVSRHHRS